MKIKSFKKFITETDGKIDLDHGLWTFTYDETLHASIEGYNFILNNWNNLKLKYVVYSGPCNTFTYIRKHDLQTEEFQLSRAIIQLN